MLSSVRRQAAVLVATVAVFSLGLSALGTSGASAQTTPGVTSNSVKLGLLADLTGPLASSFGGVAQGAQARIDQQNASGGVYGRKIQLAVGDDQSNPNDALTVTQGLVQQQGIFSLMAESAFFTLVYKYLGQQQIPTVSGQPYDGGPEWADPSSHDLVDGAGAQNPNTPNLGWEWLIKILKADKITKLATLANGFSAASVAYANGIKAAAEAAGIQVVDEDNSLTETQTDLTPNAITMKKSGANGWVGLTSLFSEQALMTALHQQGATNIKAVLLGQYAGALLQPPLNSIDQGTIVPFYYKTPEISPAVGGQLVAALRKYTGYKGGSPPPNLGYYFGWASAQIAITGLQAAGKNLTVNSYLNGLHKQAAYTAGGLQVPVNLAQIKQGTYAPAAAGNCEYALKVSGTKFVPLSTQPYCTPTDFYKQ
jgi:branched-chain amino acid transport system substrate-binding protein